MSIIYAASFEFLITEAGLEGVKNNKKFHANVNMKNMKLSLIILSGIFFVEIAVIVKLVGVEPKVDFLFGFV